MSLENASLIVTPNAYKAGKLYSVIPQDGSGDATVVRNTTKTRVNSSGLIESNAVNVLAPDYLNGVCPALNVEGQSTNLLLNSVLAGGNSTTAPTSYTGTGFNLATYQQSKFVDGQKLSITKSTSERFLLSQFVNLTANVNYTISILINNVDVSNLVFKSVIDTSLGTKVFKINNTVVSGTSFVPLGESVLTIDVSSATTTSADLRFGHGTFLQESTFGTIVLDLPQFIENYVYEQSYIPTTTASVTRSADNVTVPIPAGTTEIIEKYEDGTTNTITTIPASPYTVPVGRYEYILMR